MSAQAMFLVIKCIFVYFHHSKADREDIFGRPYFQNCNKVHLVDRYLMYLLERFIHIFQSIRLIFVLKNKQAQDSPLRIFPSPYSRFILQDTRHISFVLHSNREFLTNNDYMICSQDPILDGLVDKDRRFLLLAFQPPLFPQARISKFLH